MLAKSPRITAVSIDDVALGEVLAIRSCCFEVQLEDGLVCLREEAIFSVQNSRVTLVCMAANLSSYSCSLHSSAALQEAMPARTSVARRV